MTNDVLFDICRHMNDSIRIFQVLASRESLVESLEESESDDAILMSQVSNFFRSFALVYVHGSVKEASIGWPACIINANVNLIRMVNDRKRKGPG